MLRQSLIEPAFQLWMGSENLAGACGVASIYSGDQLFRGVAAAGEGVDVFFQVTFLLSPVVREQAAQPGL
jgi:hypothetical protein